MTNDELIVVYPELDYIRKWTEAIEAHKFEEALSILAEALQVAKKRKSIPLVKHLQELKQITKTRVGLASGQRKGTGPLDVQARVRCSFCGKKRTQVSTMIAGARSYICNECVELCSQIVLAESH